MSKLDKETAIALVNKGFSNYTIAKQLGVNESTVRRFLRKSGITKSEGFDTNVTEYISLEPPMVHVGECMVTADYHFPLFDPVISNDMVSDAVRLGIKTLIIAGDIFNMDALSRFEPKQENAALWNEIEVAQAAMEIFLNTFDEIYCIKGNHDNRLVKTLRFKLKFDQSMRLIFGALGETALEKIKFSNLDHMWIKPLGYTSMPTSFYWLICHPSSGYTQVPLSKARVVSDKYNCNVIAAHSHHFALGWARDGKKIVAEAGGMFDAKKTAYLQDTTTYPIWANGYMWLTNRNGLLGIGTPDKLWVPRT